MARKDPSARARTIGEPYSEVITISLTPSEVAEQRSELCTLLDAEEKLDERLARIKAEIKAEATTVEDKIKVTRRRISTKQTDVEVTLQQYLTVGNEVIIVRTDTDDIMYRRTATARELQEDLFADRPAVTPDDGFGGS